MRFSCLKIFLKHIKSWIWIKDGVTITFPENVSIGRNSTLNEFVFIDGYGGVHIGSCVRIGHNSSIVSENHGFDDISTPIYLQEKTGKAVIIEDDVWIGCKVTVLMGVTIGKGSVIGAGAVVTRDIPPYSVAMGNPARVLKSRK